MRRVTVLLLVVAAAAGCGSGASPGRDGRGTAHAGPVTGPYLFDMAGTLKELRAGGLRLRRTGRSRVADRSLPAPERAGGFVVDGTPVSLLVYSSEDVANDALPSLGDLESQTVIGKNVLAVVRRRGQGYARVRQAVGDLGQNPPGPEPSAPAPGEPDS